MAADLHPSTYEIRVKFTDVTGTNAYTSSHWVWDSYIFMAARQLDAANLNAKHLKETGTPGKAKAELL